MKKFVILIFALLITQAVFAGLNDVFIVDITYDWINKSEVEKEAVIQEVHDIMFKNPPEKKDDLRTLFKDKLKDKNYIENYYAASAGYKEYKENKISAFYFKNLKHIYMYALQEKNNSANSFYYDALGHLKYVDFIEGYYPDYPYYAVQYRISGAPVSAVFYVSDDCQYLFKPSGEFEGVWYKKKLYNKKNKIIMKRSTY